MPTYTYRCQSCGVVFDKVQKFSDKALTRCPECRTGAVHRIPQPPAIVFKGSGWYSTDHRSPSGQSSLRSKTDGDSKKADADGKKSDGEAAKTTETAAASTTASTAEKSDSKPTKKKE